MYIPLGTATLKTGQEMEIGVVQGPDHEYADRLREFLGHKPDSFKRHIALSLAGPLEELETRFYIGRLGPSIITQVMTVEYAGVGLLGHVFTRPEHRRQGAYRAVMARQMEDFRRRGGQLLLLGTGYESPPYWIYYSFGFRSVTDGSGFMRYSASDDFEARWFAPAPAQVVPVKWRHWPTLSALFAQREGPYLRNVALGILGQRNFEGGFLDLREALQTPDPSSGQPLPQAQLLESKTGAVVGCATMWPDSQWPGTYLLDVFVHPHFEAGLPDLLAALAPVEAKVLAYAEASATAKNAALAGAGFRREGRLTRQLLLPDGRAEDVWLWGR